MPTAQCHLRAHRATYRVVGSREPQAAFGPALVGYCALDVGMGRLTTTWDITDPLHPQFKKAMASPIESYNWALFGSTTDHSRLWASAEASWARSWRVSSATRTCPARTCAPDSKEIRSTTPG